LILIGERPIGKLALFGLIEQFYHSTNTVLEIRH